MRMQTTAPELFPRRLHELEEQFTALESQLADSPQKQAFSVLHGMIQEVWRNVNATTLAPNAQGFNIQDIADLYRHAPKMEGPAANTPLPNRLARVAGRIRGGAAHPGGMHRARPRLAHMAPPAALSDVQVRPDRNIGPGSAADDDGRRAIMGRQGEYVT